jgi:hypothetical protein
MEICRSLESKYDGDPRNVLSVAQCHVPCIISLLRSSKEQFPYLNGPKMANYWLYILSRFTDVSLTGRDEISIIPDVHVIRATRFLGLSQNAVETPMAVAEIWRSGLTGTDISPVDMHAPLWRWSRAGFNPGI